MIPYGDSAAEMKEMFDWMILAWSYRLTIVGGKMGIHPLSTSKAAHSPYSSSAFSTRSLTWTIGHREF
ncbi:unnamed protein product [Citrullus colocynthis]|uniref:Uncharacterized protein n=1 Tax=Citrullus colocynthis TaxID=252529 RepID=A0ABP0XRF3_9ROSI